MNIFGVPSSTPLSVLAHDPKQCKLFRMARKTLDTLKKAKEQLEQHGYVVRRNAACIKHTFQVEVEVYKAFRSTVSFRGFSVKDAVNEALSNWVSKHSVK